MSTVYTVYEDSLFAVDTDTASMICEHRFGSRPEAVVGDGDTVLVGTFEHGLQRSTDGGQSWERPDGIEEEAVMAVTLGPDDSDTVYIGTEPSGVYRSLDGGRTFERLDGLLALDSSGEWSFPPRPDTHHVRWIEPDPADSNVLHVAIEAGAQVRAHIEEDGVRWEDRVPGARRDVHSITTHPDASGHAWVAAGDGYAETPDGGDSWHHPQAGLEHTYCWSVAVGLNETSTGMSTPSVLLSSAPGAGAAHRRGESYLYRRDGGAWEPLDDHGIPTGEGVFRAVLARGDTEEMFWAANNHGLYRTDDSGDSWTEIGVSWPERIESQTCRGLSLAD